MRYRPTPLLALLTLTLAACNTTTSTPSAALKPPEATRPAPGGSGKLGVVEIEFSGGGSRPLRASVVPQLGAQAVSPASCATLGSAVTQSIVDAGGKHYLQATFPVTNNCGRDLNNLTYVAARRIDGTPTIGGTAVTLMTTATGLDADPALAAQIMPTQAVYASGSRLRVDQDHASLQVFDDFDGSELDSFQAAIDPARITYDLLAYGYAATTTAGARLIPNGGSGEVTFSVSLPIQPTPAQDVYTFRLLMSPGTNNVSAITQGLEEQDAAGRIGVIGRAAKFSYTEIRTLLGPDLTPANVAPGGRVVCQVRTAGPRGAATATLVNAVGNVSVSNIARPLVLGGAQNQPLTVVTYNGQNFVSRGTYFNPEVGKLGITSNYLHPLGLFPLTRQSARVQLSACNQTRPLYINTSPFTSLSTQTYAGAALLESGAVTVWGSSEGGTLIPAEAQTGVVAVAASDVAIGALKSDGRVVVWGEHVNEYTLSPVPAAAQSGVMAIGMVHGGAYALKSNGSVVGWGNAAEPVPVEAQSGVVAIATGSSAVMALKANGGVVSWGQDFGRGPVPPAARSGVIAIAVTDEHGLALKNDGSVIAWGGLWEGDTFGLNNVPVAAKRNVIAIAMDGGTAMALKNDGSVVAWGNNASGQTDVPAAALSGVVAISAGSGTGYALKADGSIVTWGDNSRGQRNVPAVAGGFKVP